MRGNRQHRHPAAVAIKQSVDEVQVAGTATSGTHGELTGQVGLRPGGERGSFLVPHVNPFDAFQPTQRVGEAVEGIPNDSIDSLYHRRWTTFPLSSRRSSYSWMSALPRTLTINRG